MRESIAVLVGVLYLVSARSYIKRMREGKAMPTLATWLLFSFATLLNALSFAKESDFDWVSGSLGIADVIFCLAVTMGVIRHVTKRIVFRKFEWLYFTGAIVTVFVWIGTGSAFGTNMLAQVLIFIGYFPTVHNILKTKQNTEPFFVWGCSLVAGMLALYPALTGGEILSVVYAVRTVIMVSLLMFLMKRYTKKET